jgi:hypothetical protein
MDPSSHVRTDLLINPRADGAFRNPQVEIGLEPKPKLGGDAKVLAQSERGVCSNSTFPVDNSADSARRDGNIPSQFIDANTHWLHELLKKDFSRMDWFEQLLACHRSSFLMIVNDLNVIGIAATPQEAYTPLITNADTVLTFTVALQCFQAIPWRNHQILQGASTVQVQQLSPRYSLKGPKARHVHISEQRFRLPGSERADHRILDYYAPRHSSRDAVISTTDTGQLTKL